MAIIGDITLKGGVLVKDTYVKVFKPTVIETGQVVNNKKVFNLHYEYEYKKDSTSEPFFHWVEQMENVNIDNNLFVQAYSDLAAKLNISNSQV